MGQAPSHRDRTYTSQDGLALYFRDYGPLHGGPHPILCLPGLTRNSHDYHPLAVRLSVDRRVICPDLRGRGRSAWDSDWRNYNPQTYINDLRHLLTLLNIHRTVVIGTSMGGLLGMGLNVGLPTHVAGIVLNDVGPDIDANGLRRILAYIGRDHPANDWPQAIATLKSIMQDTPGMTEDDWLDVAKGTFRQETDGKLHVNWDIAIARMVEQSQGEYSLWPLYRSLRHIPALAIRGGLSDVLEETTFDRMAREKPDLVRETVAGVGHTPTLAEPTAIAALDRFLRSIP
ncbi:MAG: alpha/beta hydrolase [Rhodospirillales bacterium]|nr:alpha/beta hydrolase [Rhodospirillales bacterium]MCW8862728.1 alpha/beta hydrolase [Rhodospirillales bacterium]MCW8951747.1 alpha/beta hydrolase [Rhodospirillales bacterium]MCW8971050.1 alpha/beta hydrolase [Rhodospirillales bacterium]MCW9003422.1 alpha/beta hydrolase [Rhodospirillales bacterium]